MNREIKFRGQDCENDFGWRYGSLISYPNGERVIVEFDNDWDDLDYDVVPNTVGQFTGLRDKKDKEIYEGDIIATSKDDKKYVVTSWDGMYYASVEELNEGVYGGYPLRFLLVEYECEVVGNIHEQQAGGEE